MPDFNLQFPSFRANEMDDGQQQRRIISYLKSLHEQLTYLMNNLDEDNLGESLASKIDGMESSEDASASMGGLRYELIWTGGTNINVGNHRPYGQLGTLTRTMTGRRIDDTVTINVMSDTVGRARFDGLTGPGRIVVEGNGHDMVGSVTLDNCMVPVIIRNMGVGTLVHARNCRYLELDGVTIHGNTLYSLFLEEGARCHLDGVKFSAPADNLIRAGQGVMLTAHNLSGEGTNFIQGSHMIALMDGTRPSGGKDLTACVTVPDNLSSLIVDDGTGAI